MPAARPAHPTGHLPLDADGVLKVAAQSMFETLASTVLGMMVVDREHRIVWISEGCKQFLPALERAESDFVGRPVEEVVPNTLMAQVIDTGQAIPVDLLTNKAGIFRGSRLPLRDASGAVIGAMGMVLLDHPETSMQPLIAKCSRLQHELDDARRQIAAHVTQPRRPRPMIASFIGASPLAVEVKRQARRVAQTDSTVLLLGETGTGKELLAHGIHAASARAATPFIAVNIAAVPETLLDAEFFGVAPGASTGADHKGREGKFRTADGGTLLLDEIGDMPITLQSKLLRVLQEQEVEPLGSNQVQRIDVHHRGHQPRPAATCRRWWRPAPSAPTCETGSTCCRSACRPCATAPPTRQCWSTRWPKASRGAAACRTRACRLMRWTCWRGTAGPATSASSAMRSNRRR